MRRFNPYVKLRGVADQLHLGYMELDYRDDGAVCFADEAIAEVEKLRAENEALRQLISAQAQALDDANDKMALQAKLAEREAVIEAVVAVANESDGIAGWHKNGNIASWEEILPEIFTAAPEQEPKE